MARMLWGAWRCGARGVGVGGGQRPAAFERHRALVVAPALRFGAQGAGAFTARLLGWRMAPLTLLPMPAVPRWGRGAGIAGARAVRRRRWDGRIRAPCVIRGVSAAKRAPPWQDLRAVHPRKAVCGAFRMHGARILPKPARFGYTATISCQGGALFPSGAPSGMHEAKKLPRIAARERIAREYCHCWTLRNAPRRNIATDGRPAR